MRIPRYEQRVERPGPPGIRKDPRVASAKPRIWGQLGQAFSSTGQKILERIVQAHKHTAVGGALTEAKKTFGQFVLDRQVDPEYTKYLEKFTDLRGTLEENLKKDMPFYAKKDFKLSYDSLADQYNLRVQDFAQKKSIEYGRDGAFDDIKADLEIFDFEEAGKRRQTATADGLFGPADEHTVDLMTATAQARVMGYEEGIKWLNTAEAREEYEIDASEAQSVIRELRFERQALEAEAGRKEQELEEAAWKKGSGAYFRGELKTIPQVEELEAEGLSTDHANQLKSWIIAGNKAAIADYKNNLKDLDKEAKDRLEAEKKNLISKYNYDIAGRKDAHEVQTEMLDDAEVLGERALRDLITKNNKRVWSDPVYNRALGCYISAIMNGILSDEQGFNMQDQFRERFDPLIFKPDGTLREDRPKYEEMLEYVDSMIQPFIGKVFESILHAGIKPYQYRGAWSGYEEGYIKVRDIKVLEKDVEKMQDIEYYQKFISEGMYSDLSPEQLKYHQPLFEHVKKEQEWHYKRWSKHDWNEAGKLKSTELTDYGHAVFTDTNGRKWAFYIVNNNEVLKEWTPLDKTPEIAGSVGGWDQIKTDFNGQRWGWKAGDSEWTPLDKTSAGETKREYPVLGQYEVPIENEKTGEIIIFNRKTGEKRLYER